MDKYAAVFSGGGARGAFEAGVFYYIRCQMEESAQNHPFPIYTGTSVGGLNACLCASLAHNPYLQGQELKRLWLGLEQKDVYRRDMLSLGRFLGHSCRSTFANLTRGVALSKTHFKGLLDTSPLEHTIQQEICFEKIQDNINTNHLKALCIAATNVSTGSAELFIQKDENLKYTGDYITHMTPIHQAHLLASTAIPIVFPATSIEQKLFVDGGLRLNTPMAPAIQLGANKILIISVQHITQHANGTQSSKATLGEILSRVFNSIFIDKIRSDYDQTRRINRIIEWGEAVYGPAFLTEINQHLKKHNITGDIANRGLKKVEVLRITPSIDLGVIFQNTYAQTSAKEISLFERILVRLLDIDPSSGFDFLSYITFMPHYLHALFEQGIKDAHAQREHISHFLNIS